MDIATIKQRLEEALERLDQDVAVAYRSDPNFGNERFDRWKRNISKVFSPELSLLARKIISSGSMVRMWARRGYTDSHYFFDDVKNKVEQGINSLLIDIRNEEFDPKEYMEVEEMVKDAQSNIDLNNRKCFIVHGRDNVFKLEVARHLEKKGFNSIILHEQPSGGRTVIEKLMRYAAECEFAIVLYTPDDEGGLTNSDVVNKRARQNVIFEHGLTIGLMGRNKVFTLVSDDSIETPNDISGVVYIPQNNWKHDLDKEIQELGYTF